MSRVWWFDWAAIVAALLVSAAFGYVALRGVDWASTSSALGQTNYGWIVPSLAILGIWTALRAIRWRVLFRPEARPGLQPIAQATVVGLFFNSILPARAGEAARILWLRSHAGVSGAESTATIVVDRLFDVLCLFALLFSLLPWLPHVPWLRAGALAALGTLCLTLLLVAGVVYLERRPPEWLVRRSRVYQLANSVAHGTAAIRNPRQAAIVGAWTFASWLVLGLAFWFLMLGSKLHLSPSAGVLVSIAVGLSFVIPAAPAGIGVFEAAGLAVMSAYGIPESRGVAYVLVLHAFNTVPFLLAGPAVVASGMWRRQRLGSGRRSGSV